MRMLMNITFPHEPFNTLCKENVVGTKMKQILETIRPENAYFTEQNGHRGAFLVVDVPHESVIPELAEPWFLIFNADVQFRILMSPNDLERAGLDSIGKRWS